MPRSDPAYRIKVHFRGSWEELGRFGITIVNRREALWSPNRLRRQYPKVTLKKN